jgi:hypothetical protein
MQGHLGDYAFGYKNSLETMPKADGAESDAEGLRVIRLGANFGEAVVLWP